MLARMSFWPLRFDGSFPAEHRLFAPDDAGRVDLVLQVRCFGEGVLVAPDPMAFAAACAQNGGPAAIQKWAESAILAGAATKFHEVAKGYVPQALRANPKLSSEVAMLVSAQIAQLGASVRIQEWSLSLSPEDIEVLKNDDAKKAKRQVEEREEAAREEIARSSRSGILAAPIAHGTRVIARLADGNEHAGVIRQQKDGYYEIGWDAGGGGWVPMASVRLA